MILFLKIFIFQSRNLDDSVAIFWWIGFTLDYSSFIMEAFCSIRLVIIDLMLFGLCLDLLVLIFPTCSIVLSFFIAHELKVNLLMFTQITANLVPLNSRRVAVKFDFFRIAGLIPIKSPGSGRGQLEITYLDEELR